MIENLLKPGKIGKMELKNRLIYSGITFKVGDNHGHLTSAEVESMRYRAKQEYSPALITFPGLNSSMFNTVKAVNINDKEAVYALRQNLERVKINQTKAMAILGVLGNSKNNDYTLGASNLHYPTEIREMSLQEIESYIKEVGRIAKNAQEAGFDAIRLQTGTPKKILSYFISPYANKRTDQYGGSTFNRVRLVKEVLEEIRNKVGENMALILELRMEEIFYGGITLDEGLRMAEILAPYVDAVEPSLGRYGKVLDDCEAYFAPYGSILQATKLLKDNLPELKVIASGKMGNAQLADQAVASGETDFVAMARPLLADPEWISKMATGRAAEVNQCIGCLNCFTENMRTEIYPPKHRACTVNPANLREEDFYNLKPTTNPQNILVVGGGLAGMEAAITLAKRGHNVTLCEQKPILGGQWVVASKSIEKADYRTLLTRKIKELEQSGAKICLNTLVDRSYLAENKPDVTILATGAVPRELPHEKLDKAEIFQGNDIIMGQEVKGQKVVVVGGRYIGLETALMLAKAGKDVSVVDMQELGSGANDVLIRHYLERLIECKVKLYPNSPVSRLTDDGVEIMHSTGLLMLKAEAIVLAVGTKPQRELQEVLEELELVYCPIGDAKRIGDALYAIRDGAEIGRLI